MLFLVYISTFSFRSTIRTMMQYEQHQPPKVIAVLAQQLRQITLTLEVNKLLQARVIVPRRAAIRTTSQLYHQTGPISGPSPFLPSMEKWHTSKGPEKNKFYCYSAIWGYGIEKVVHFTTGKQTEKYFTARNRLLELIVYDIICVCDGLCLS